MEESYLYDPKLGSEVMTMGQAAKLLKYNEVSVRYIVSKGDLKPCRKIGKTWLFSRKDVEVYKLNRKRVGGPEEHKLTAELSKDIDLEVKPEELTGEIKASLELDLGLGSVFPHRQGVEKFKWENIPSIRADLKDKYKKDVHFKLVIKMPDGSTWTVEHEPESVIAKAFERLRGKK